MSEPYEIFEIKHEPSLEINDAETSQQEEIIGFTIQEVEDPGDENPKDPVDDPPSAPKKLIVFKRSGNSENFKCDQCHRSFSNHESLLIHKNFHDVELINCRICDEKIIRNSLKFHMETEHGAFSWNLKRKATMEVYEVDGKKRRVKGENDEVTVEVLSDSESEVGVTRKENGKNPPPLLKISQVGTLMPINPSAQVHLIDEESSDDDVMIVEDVQVEEESNYIINEVDINDCDEEVINEESEAPNFDEEELITSYVIEKVTVEVPGSLKLPTPSKSAHPYAKPKPTFSIATNSTPLKVQCRICNEEIFDSEDFIRAHMKTHDIPCKVCGLLMKKDEVDSHMKLHDQEQKMKNFIQSYNESGVAGFSIAFGNHLKPRPKVQEKKKKKKVYFTCDFCGASFQNDSALKHHEKLHKVKYIYNVDKILNK